MTFVMGSNNAAISAGAVAAERTNLDKNLRCVGNLFGGHVTDDSMELAVGHAQVGDLGIFVGGGVWSGGTIPSGDTAFEYGNTNEFGSMESFGWTAANTYVLSGSTFGTTFNYATRIYYKILDTEDLDSGVHVFGGIETPVTTAMAAFRADTSVEIDFVASTQGNSINTLAAPTGTTSQDGELLLYISMFIDFADQSMGLDLKPSSNIRPIAALPGYDTAAVPEDFSSGNVSWAFQSGCYEQVHAGATRNFDIQTKSGSNVDSAISLLVALKAT